MTILLSQQPNRMPARIVLSAKTARVSGLDDSDLSGHANAHELVGTLRNIFAAYRILSGVIDVPDIDNPPRPPYLDRARFEALRRAGARHGPFVAALASQHGPQPLVIPLLRFVGRTTGDRHAATHQLLKACAPVAPYLQMIGLENLLIEARPISVVR